MVERPANCTRAATRSAWCREHGVYRTELETWKRDAIRGLGEPRETEGVSVQQDRRRIKELERGRFAETPSPR